MLATTVVAACPVAIVWWLRATSTVTSAPIGIGLGMAISLGLSYFGRILWETRPGSEDVLFSELMVWGYLHRLRTQRRLANVAELLEPVGGEPARAHPRRQAKNVKSLQQLVSGLETRDPYLHGHSRRVARYSWMIARKMGLPGEEVARIRTAAAIHDVGKIHTPKSILHKPDRLTDAEYEVIKRHPGEGAEMVEVLDDARITAIVRHHHERFDGSGYPAALKGDEIPLGARIVAVADTFDAITSSRAYRAASPHKKAIDIIKGEAGTRLDADVVKAFCDHYAGRGPLAVWSFVAGLPERIVTWLGSGAASVATAAKVAAVAAIVGGTTAVTAAVTPTKAPQRHHSSAGTLAAVVSPRSVAASSSGPAKSSRPAGGSTSSHHAHPRSKVRRTAAAPAPAVNRASTPAPTQSASAGAPAASGTTASQYSPVGGGSTQQPGETKAAPPAETPSTETGPPKQKLEKTPETPAEIKREELAVKAEEKAAKEKTKAEEKAKAEEEAKAEETAKAEERAARAKEKAEERAAREKAHEEKEVPAKGKGPGGKGEEAPSSSTSTK